MPRFQMPAALLVSVALTIALAVPAVAAAPEYELAYVGGNTVTINAIEVPNPAPLQAQADLYLVVYPIGWTGSAPQCNPCDHSGDGIDLTDFHDHVLDSMPSKPGHGEFSPLWHVFAVVPAYSFLTGGDPANDAAVSAAYGAQLPVTSETAVDALLGMQLGDGSPVAIEIDTHFYFLCAVVSPNAAQH
jgi:hypothetical protein